MRELHCLLVGNLLLIGEGQSTQNPTPFIKNSKGVTGSNDEFRSAFIHYTIRTSYQVTLFKECVTQC
ncbi:MAG TPA: hypothetical protein VGQ51_08290 [Puia sp.]|nr:hypothetical protein [Puia sp.]